MFNLKEFIKTNIINGIKNGTFTKEYGNILAVNYLVKGILSEEDIYTIDKEITDWEIAKEAEKEAMNNPVVIPEVLPEEMEKLDEEPLEEVVEDETMVEPETEGIIEEDIEPEVEETE